MKFLQGKKTFITSLIIAVLTVLVGAGVVSEEWAAEMQLASIAVVATFLRLGMKTEAEKTPE